MIPLTKVLSLCIRLFSRPVAAVLKKSCKGAEDKGWVCRQFIALGRIAYGVEVGVRDRVLRKSGRVRWIDDGKAMDIGVEYFFEAAVYGFLTVWGVYEFCLYRKEAEGEKRKFDESILDIFNKIERLSEDFENVEKRFEARGD